MCFLFRRQRQGRTALQSKVVFNKFGKKEYFLSQIWHPFYENSMKLTPSNHEVVTSKLVTGLRPEKVEIRAAARLPESVPYR